MGAAHGSDRPVEKGMGLMLRRVLVVPVVLASLGLLPAGASAEEACPNAALRTGPSAKLPDCRAYELVSPADTGGLVPDGRLEINTGFNTPLATADGNDVFFVTEPALPGAEGPGVMASYKSVRSTDGWTTHLIGPTGPQAVYPSPHGLSADHRYLIFGVQSVNGQSNFEGSLAMPGVEVNYFQGPDGIIHLLGQGSLTADPAAEAHWVSADGGHIIFTTEVALEPDATAAPNKSVYDRTQDGAVHVASFLPGDLTPSTSSPYRGASADGSVVLFENSGDLYARVDDERTLWVAGASPVTPAGVSQNGAKVFYVQSGNVYSFDTATQAKTLVAGSGDVELVNISADGSHVYFVSHQQIDGEGVAGQLNLYVWDEASESVRFIVVLDPTDVTGVQNLTTWTPWVSAGSFETGRDPSRTTPDGTVFVFESHANLTAYDSGGHSEVYRYDAADESLLCVSCAPGGSPAVSNAQLENISLEGGLYVGTNGHSRVENVTDDGNTVFFQTGDPLVARDTNGVTDVYEWHDGQVSLISSGQAAHPSNLYSTTPSGRDIFFTTSVSLVPQDENGGTIRIYDARIDGGISQAVKPVECEGDACQGEAGRTPELPSMGSSVFTGMGNLLIASKPVAPALKPLTRAQKLARALKVCERKPKAQRRRCRVQARKRYGPKRAHKGTPRRAGKTASRRAGR